MLVNMILFKRNIFVNQSYISFYKSNGTIELWMTNMKIFDPIKQKHIISTYFRKQDQYAQQSYYSILKIISTITSFSLPINTTSRIKEKQWTWIEKQESWIKKKEKRKTFETNTLSLREFILCDIQSTYERLELHCKFTLSVVNNL